MEETQTNTALIIISSLSVVSIVFSSTFLCEAWLARVPLGVTSADSPRGYCGALPGRA